MMLENLFPFFSTDISHSLLHLNPTRIHSLIHPPFLSLVQASHLLQGDLRASPGEARHLLAGATSFFRGLKHQWNDDGQQGDGLQEIDDFEEDWSQEGKAVFMFSGCRDEQTSADAFINGRHVGEFHCLFIPGRVRVCVILWGCVLCSKA